MRGHPFCLSSYMNRPPTWRDTIIRRQIQATKGPRVRACGPFLLYQGGFCFFSMLCEGEGIVPQPDVLVLNSNYEPLNICNVRRAISLLLLGKAEVLHLHDSPILTGRGPLHVPSVLKMRYQVRRPMPQLRLSRHSILARDNFTCQYCGVKGRDLTIDHVIPRWAGGPQTWDNLGGMLPKVQPEER